MEILKVENLCRFFGGVKAVNDVSFSIEEKGTIMSLIGPNGAGKTTAFQCISGFIPVMSGKVTFDGVDITKKHVHDRVALGMGRSFQKSQIFGEMTVIDNILCGMHLNMKAGFISAGFQLPIVRKEEAANMQKAEELLDYVGLLSKKDWQASELAYGEKRMLEIARALGYQTKLLLLDEPAAGLNGAEKDVLFAKIKDIASTGVVVLLVEHDMGMVMNISDHVVVLNFGEVIARGKPEQVKNDPKVLESYLGKGFRKKIESRDEASQEGV